MGEDTFLQRLAEGELRAGPEGRITAGSLPNLAFSIPLAQLRLWQQRTERTAAAASRAGTSWFHCTGTHSRSASKDVAMYILVEQDIYM